jgi:hypothetical protein
MDKHFLYAGAVWAVIIMTLALVNAALWLLNQPDTVAMIAGSAVLIVAGWFSTKTMMIIFKKWKNYEQN